MAIKHHTIIFVPHARAKLRKWRVTNLQLALSLGAILLLTISSVVVLWASTARGVDGAQVDRLRAENERLRETNRTFEESLTELQGRIGEFESRTRQLAIVAGLDGLESDPGIGGEFDGEAGIGDLDFLDFRTRRLASGLDQVATKLEERGRWIASTPSITPVRGILTSTFGNRRDPINGGRAWHPAIDIAAPPGRPVAATADGIVTRASRIGGLGNAVYLSHGFGITTRYGHMSRLAVEPGQQVQRGDIVGYVGNTGRSTGYHLHYEVHVDGRPINPLAYILDGSLGF